MDATSQSELTMLDIESASLLKHSRLDCCKVRMESFPRLCWILRTCSTVVLAVVFLNLLVAVFTLGAPTQSDPSSSAAPTTTIPAGSSYPAATEEKDGGSVQQQPPQSEYDPAEPRELPFFKNSHCKLHKEDGRSVSRRCGLRELDVPKGNDGVHLWIPHVCRSSHCQCVATKEFRRREKRTILNNKTDIEYRRFRLFECV